MASLKTQYTDGARRGFLRLGVILAGWGITADMLTFAGLALTGVAAWLIIEGHFIWAAVAFGIASACDGMDGAVARAGRGPTRSGAFLDSTLDRVSEIITFGALAYYMADADRMWEFAPVLVCLGSALMVSYARARAEALGTDCKVGFMSRPERLVGLMHRLRLRRPRAVRREHPHLLDLPHRRPHAAHRRAPADVRHAQPARRGARRRGAAAPTEAAPRARRAPRAGRRPTTACDILRAFI